MKTNYPTDTESTMETMQLCTISREAVILIQE